MSERYVIDWRTELSRLAPFLEGRGGVVAVRATANAPASVFARAVRTVMQQSESMPWKTMQIEPSNSNTHYLPEILLQMHTSFEIPLARSTTGEPTPVTIASEIDAGGNVDVSDVTVTIGTSEYDELVREGQRIRYLVDSLGETLDSTRVGVITLAMQESSREIVRQVRRRLWDDALATLTGRGLLLIDISDPDAMPGDDSLWPPPADLTFDLPERFDDAASAIAREDLRDIALAEGVFYSREAADGFAVGLVASTRDVRELHAKLALALARLQ